MNQLAVETPDTAAAGDAASGVTEACGPLGAGELMAEEQAAELATVLAALGHPVRLRLFDWVAGHAGGTVCACHIPDALGISQPTMSHHLSKLVAAGLLIREQRGRWAHFTVVPAALERVRGLLADCC